MKILMDIMKNLRIHRRVFTEERILLIRTMPPEPFSIDVIIRIKRHRVILYCKNYN
jgi:hypothetical protein